MAPAQDSIDAEDLADKTAHLNKLLDSDALLDEPALRLEASSGVPPAFRGAVWRQLLHVDLAAPRLPHASFAALSAAFDRDGALGMEIRAALRAAPAAARIAAPRSPATIRRFLSVVGAYIASTSGSAYQPRASSISGRESVRDMVMLAAPVLSAFPVPADARSSEGDRAYDDAGLSHVNGVHAENELEPDDWEVRSPSGVVDGLRRGGSGSGNGSGISNRSVSDLGRDRSEVGGVVGGGETGLWGGSIGFDRRGAADASAFAVFSGVMRRAESFYRRDTLDAAVRDFLMLFKATVPELHDQFVDADFDVSVWAPSALRSLLAAQLPAESVSRLIDAYVARGEADWAAFHVHVCVALLAVLHEREELSDVEPESLLPRLCNLPAGLPIDTVVNRAVTYQHDSAADGFLPAASSLADASTHRTRRWAVA